MGFISLIFLLCWLGFYLYWIASSLNVKANAIYGWRRFIATRLIILVVTIVVLSSSKIRNGVELSNGLARGNDLLLALGLLLFLLGLAFAIWAKLTLGKNWGIPMSLKKDPELVTSGPYRLVRHPIYSGILIALAASVVDVGFYFLVVLVVLGAYFTYSATVEEKLMIKQFPRDYPPYKKTTKMLIPYIF